MQANLSRYHEGRKAFYTPVADAIPDISLTMLFVNGARILRLWEDRHGAIESFNPSGKAATTIAAPTPGDHRSSGPSLPFRNSPRAGIATAAAIPSHPSTENEMAQRTDKNGENDAIPITRHNQSPDVFDVDEGDGDAEDNGEDSPGSAAMEATPDRQLDGESRDWDEPLEDTDELDEVEDGVELAEMRSIASSDLGSTMSGDYGPDNDDYGRRLCSIPHSKGKRSVLSKKLVVVRESSQSMCSTCGDRRARHMQYVRHQKTRLHNHHIQYCREVDEAHDECHCSVCSHTSPLTTCDDDESNFAPARLEDDHEEDDGDERAIEARGGVSSAMWEALWAPMDSRVEALVARRRELEVAKQEREKQHQKLQWKNNIRREVYAELCGREELVG
ncbi:hypothetical protein PINS_up000176 [Pythium insidiosum]|nr:hypothetical protein PINS_up000176 [Pythium insidiosum]